MNSLLKLNSEIENKGREIEKIRKKVSEKETKIDELN